MILSLWKKKYGEEITEKMAADFQKEKPITIRCCMNRVTPEVLKEKLEAEGAKVEAHPYLPYAFYLSDYDYLEGLESFQEGLLQCRISVLCLSENWQLQKPAIM